MDEFKINFDGTEIPIPTKTSQLENDSGFATQSAVESSASSTLDSANAYADNKFNGANKAVSFVNYSSMITSLNTLSNTSYSVGQNIMIVTLEVPDLWVSEVAETSVAYTYVSDDVFVADLNTNGSVQVGYYKLSALETQKVDLTEYVKNTDYATASKAGLIRANSSQGLFISETGDLSLVQAQPTDLVNKTNKFRPLTANNMDEAFKVSMTTNTIELTDEEKASTQAWLGVPSVERVNEVEADIPTKTSDLTNDSAFITAKDIPASDVTSVNGKTGAVELSAGDVNALPDTTKIPSKTSDLTNDSGFITRESDPTVPSWAKQASKPTYTYSEITETPAIPTKVSELENDRGFTPLSTVSVLVDAVDKKVTPTTFLNGGDISSNTYLPIIEVGQMGIVSYRSTTNTTIKLYLPSSGSYDYALILGNPYHSSGGTGVSNGISGTNTAGGSHLTDIVNNSKYTAVMVLYRRVS